MAGAGFTWTCRCGEFQASVPQSKALPLKCYCTFCRHFIKDFDAEDTLDDQGGVAYVHITPDKIHIEKGHDLLEVVHYSTRGGRRWYTSCCGTPFANTFPSRGIAYVTMTSHWLQPQGALGSARTLGFPKSALGDPKPEQRSVYWTGAIIASRAVLARLTGRHKHTPFFDRDGQPARPLQRRPRPRG